MKVRTFSDYANDQLKRHVSILIVILGLILALLVAPGGEQANASLAAKTQQVSLSGWFHVIWVDRPSKSGIEIVEYVLVDDQGQWTRIQLDENLARLFGGPLALNGKRVTILGVWESAPLSRGQVRGNPSISVQSIQLQNREDATAAAVRVDPEFSGSKPFVTILCRFADFVAHTPQPKSWFEGLMSSSYPGMDHYWREVSYNSINLTSSVVVGWYNLPQPLMYYVEDVNGNGEVDPADYLKSDLALIDCAGVADADVFFPDFYGINLMFNHRYGCCAMAGSSISLSIDGQTKNYGITWMPQDLEYGGWEDHSVLAHEMGHAFGLPHSSGNYNYAYDSKWDVMSHSQRPCSPRGTYGCTGVHTISYHKDRLGWIPPSRKFVPTLGSNQTITIEQLGQPVSGSNYLTSEIPITGSATRFYTVEARRFAGYDAKIPGEAIIIHDVDTTRGYDRPARVVDVDNNGDPNDAAAMWTPGETFTDAANQITVTINSATATGFVVTIEYFPTLTQRVYLPLLSKNP